MFYVQQLILMSTISLSFIIHSDIGLLQCQDISSVAGSCSNLLAVLVSCSSYQGTSDKLSLHYLPITATVMKSVIDPFITITDSTASCLVFHAERASMKKSEKSLSYICDVRLNSLSSPLQQSLGQVIRLFIQILDRQRNSRSENMLRHIRMRKTTHVKYNVAVYQVLFFSLRIPLGGFKETHKRGCFTSSRLQGSH